MAVSIYLWHVSRMKQRLVWQVDIPVVKFEFVERVFLMNEKEHVVVCTGKHIFVLSTPSGELIHSSCPLMIAAYLVGDHY